MKTCNRRSLLSAFGIALPFGLAARPGASTGSADDPPLLRLRPFEDAVREAFADRSQSSSCRRVEIGHSEQVRAGVQGCHNDRPFAGFPEGCLRIVRTGSEPGSIRQGVRLYVSTVDIILTDGLPPAVPSRALDFASLPPAPVFA